MLEIADLRDVFLSSTPVVFTSYMYIVHCYIELYFSYGYHARTHGAEKLVLN